MGGAEADEVLEPISVVEPPADLEQLDPEAVGVGVGDEGRGLGFADPSEEAEEPPPLVVDRPVFHPPPDPFAAGVEDQRRPSRGATGERLGGRVEAPREAVQVPRAVGPCARTARPATASAEWPVSSSQARLTQASLRSGVSQKTGSRACCQRASSRTLEVRGGAIPARGVDGQWIGRGGSGTRSTQDHPRTARRQAKSMDESPAEWSVALDGGTTNTRARLIHGDRIVATARRAVGVRDAVFDPDSRPLAVAVRAAIGGGLARPGRRPTGS